MDNLTVVIIGYTCDEGVRRNNGRVGSKGGPEAYRSLWVSSNSAQLFQTAGNLNMNYIPMEECSLDNKNTILNTLKKQGIGNFT